MQDHGTGKTHKRSRHIGLSRMIASAGGVALLAGCGSEAAPPPAPEDSGPKTEVQAYGNVFECAAQSGMTQEECTKAREEAIAAAAETAPRFAGQGDCEAEWGTGGCVTHTSGGSSFFMPFVAGFMISRMMNGGRQNQPLFRPAGQDGYRTANGYRLGYGGAPGRYTAVARALERPAKVPAIKANSGAVSRGGFTSGSSGTSSRMRSFGG